MTPTTRTIPASLTFTPWMKDYVILGNGDYKCYRRLKLQDLMDDEGNDSEKDKAFILRLKCASLTTNVIIMRLMATRSN